MTLLDSCTYDVKLEWTGFISQSLRATVKLEPRFSPIDVEVSS